MLWAALFRLDRQRPSHRAAFGNPDFQKAVLEARANRVRLEGRIDHDLTLEGPERDLHLLEPVDRTGGRCSPHTAQPDQIADDVDAQVLAPDARYLETQDDLVPCLEDVCRRLPAIPAAQAVRELAVQLDEGMRPVLFRNPSSPG